MAERPGQRNPEYYQALMAHKVLCFGVPVALAVLAALIALLLPKTYSARSVVTATAIEYGSNRLGMARLEPSDLLPFYRDPAVAGKVLSRLGLEDPEGLSPVELLETRVNVSTPRKSSLIEVTAEMPTPGEAVALANALAEEGSAGYMSRMSSQYRDLLDKLEEAAAEAGSQFLRAEEQLSQFEARAGIDTLRAQHAVQLSQRTQLDTRLGEVQLQLNVLEEKAAVYEAELSQGTGAEEYRTTLTRNVDVAQASAALSRIEDDLLESQLELRIDRLREQVGTVQAMRAERLRRRENLEVDLAATRQKLAKLADSVERTARTVRLARRLVDDPALQQILADRSDRELQELTGLNLSIEVLNPTHSALEESLEETRAEESRLVAELAELDRLDAEAEAQLPVLHEALKSAQQQLRPKNHQRELARAKFGAATQAVGEAEAVLTSVYLPTARRLVDAQSNWRILKAEEEVVRARMNACEANVAELQAELALRESKLRRLTFDRDQAQKAAGSASDALQEARNIPWPPQRLVVTPASPPREPSSPRVPLIALLTLLGACAVTWTAAVVTEGRRNP